MYVDINNIAQSDYDELPTASGLPIYEEPDTSASIERNVSKEVKKALIITATMAFSLTSLSIVDVTPTYANGYLVEDHIISHDNGAIGSFSGYDFTESHVAGINEYFANFPLSLAFVVGMRQILDGVYGIEGTHKELRLLDDPDTGQPLLQLVFKSALPIDDEFIEMDHRIYDEIEKEGLIAGLHYVVFSNS